MTLTKVLAEQLDATGKNEEPGDITIKLLGNSTYHDEDLSGMLDVLLSRPNLLTASEAMLIFINFAPDSREFDAPLMSLYFKFIMDERVQKAHVARVLQEAEKKRPKWYEWLKAIKEKAFRFAC